MSAPLLSHCYRDASGWAVACGSSAAWQMLRWPPRAVIPALFSEADSPINDNVPAPLRGQ